MAIPARSAANPERLNASRSQFLDGLTPRLNTLSAMVDALRDKAESRSTAPLDAELGPLLRRLKAMRGAAETVGLTAIAGAFDRLLAELTSTPADGGAFERTALGLQDISRLGLAHGGHHGRAEQTGGPSAADAQGAVVGPVGPFTVVALAGESQAVILRQALESGEDFELYCTQDADEAVVLLGTYDPDMFVVDGRRTDAAATVKRADGVPVMVVDARGAEGDYRRAGARWVTQVGEHYETQLLAGLRQARRNQSMIAPKSETAVSLQGLVEDIATEVRAALLDSAQDPKTAGQVMITDRTQVRPVVWSMLARLRELATELSEGAVRYDPLTPDGTMILTGREVMRRGRRTRAAKDDLRGRRILIAEHDPSVEWYLSSLLRSKGATVLEASDGATALALARSKQPDLIICDVMLPEVDGFALCRNLKRDIVLSDVPVILLSWREDLLQRVRELGAGADGYLAKEAEASVILERCGEALEPRARIEKRLRDEKVVRGRLDGITPRLVLELASESASNVRVTFQDAAFQYEVNIGDGRILRASRTASGGDIDSGERVLPGLLGMRAGRFVVEHMGSSQVQPQLYGSLPKVIEPFVARARRACRKLKGADLYTVVRLDLDTVALKPYIAVSPAIVGKLVGRLATGTAPAELLQSVSAGLLESVLEDLALRGGILRAIDGSGVDLLELSGQDADGAFDADLETPAGERIAAASDAPRIFAGSGPEAVEAATAYAAQANANARPTTRPAPHSDRGRNPVVVVGPAAASDPEGERRSSIPPATNRATVLGIAPEAPRPERVSSLPPLPQATLHKEPTNSKAKLASAAVHPSDAITPPSGTAWSLSSAPLAAALTASPAAGEVSTSVAGYQSPPTPATPGPGDVAEKKSSDSRSGVGSTLLTSGGSNEKGSDAIELGELVAAGMVATPAVPQVTPSPQELVSVRSEPDPSSDVLRPELPVEGERIKGGPTLTGIGSAGRREASGPESIDPAWRDGWRAPNPDGVARPAPLPVHAPPPGAGPMKTGPTAGRPSETTAEIAARAGLPKQLLSRTRVVGTLRKAASVAQPVLVVAAAAVAAFVGMNHLAGEFAPGEQPEPQPIPQVLAVGDLASGVPSGVNREQDPSEHSSEELAVAPPDVAPVAAPPVISVADLPLPEDLTVPAGKGLLEVNSQGQHKLYVGNVFVGRGPVRRIPVDPGSHRVVIQADGVEAFQDVTVKPGRRLRVELAKAAP